MNKRLTKDFANGYSILNGAKYFSEAGSQNYLLFQPVFRHFKTFKSNMVTAWESKVLPDEIIKTKSDNSLNP